MIDLDWRDLTAMLTASVVLSGFLVWVLRARLADDFARKSDMVGLAGRLDGVEVQLRQAPTHADMRAVGDRIGGVEMRLGAVEREVGVTAAELRGLRDQLGAVGADVRLLLQHHIAERPQ